VQRLSRHCPKTHREYLRYGPDCKCVDVVVKDLSTYFGVFGTLLTRGSVFWFRGHSDLRYDLTPSALRYETAADRNKALQLLDEFRRLGEIQIERPPDGDDKLKWLQLAQHYGLPTRLLDWTENAAAALYFACRRPDKNGLVAIMNPIDLNRQVDAKHARLFDAVKDTQLIRPYLNLTGTVNRRGRRTIAILPILNSPRISLQKGVFTLHGARSLGLNRSQAPSLTYVPILKEYKDELLSELDRVGISEMTLFPELEHICVHLKKKANLPEGCRHG